MEVIYARSRLGNSRLNALLFKIKQADSPTCDHCPADETVHHYFLECEQFQEQRKVFRKNLADQRISPFNLEILLCNPHTTRDVELFITAAERFK